VRSEDTLAAACKPLLEKDILRTWNVKQYLLAYLKTTTRDNFDERKRDAETVIPGYFNGKYDDFERKRQYLFDLEHYVISDDEANATLRVYSTDDARQKYLDCILKQPKPNLTAWFETESEKQAILRISWISPEGSPGNITDQYLDGGQVDKAKMGKVPATASKLLLLPAFKSGNVKDRVLVRNGTQAITVSIGINGGSPITLVSVVKDKQSSENHKGYVYYETEVLSSSPNENTTLPDGSVWSRKAYVNWRHGPNPLKRCLIVSPDLEIAQAFPEVVWSDGARDIRSEGVTYNEKRTEACIVFSAHDSPDGRNSSGVVKVFGWVTQRSPTNDSTAH
jgi:hypothetical protein